LGFLDMFDSPDIMGSLLGIGSAQAAPMAPPPPQMQAPPPPPPPQMQAPLPPDQPARSFEDRAQPVKDAIEAGPAGGGFDPQMANYTKFDGPYPVPMPQPRPPGAGPDVPLGPDQKPPMQANAQVIPARPGAPQAAPLPPPAAMRGTPDTASAGGLSSAFGINPDNMRIALASLGKGMSAVGQQPFGSPGGKSFAAGLGGALEGGEHTRTTLDQQKRQRDNDLFNQKSTAFKDWVLAEKLGNETALADAKAKYWESVAAMKKQGGKESSAWQNTPYGKAAQLETMLDKWSANERLQMQAKWKALGSTPEEIKEDLANLEKKRSSERARRAKALGIDPDEYQKGTAKEHAFDFEKLTPEQRKVVPDGAWYKYRDPKTGETVFKQRDWLALPPYEGWTPEGPAQKPQTQQGVPTPEQASLMQDRDLDNAA